MKTLNQKSCFQGWMKVSLWRQLNWVKWKFARPTLSPKQADFFYPQLFFPFLLFVPLLHASISECCLPPIFTLYFDKQQWDMLCSPDALHCVASHISKHIANRSMCLGIKSGVHKNVPTLSKTSQGAVAELGVKPLSLHSQPPVDVAGLCCFSYCMKSYSLIQK